MTNIVQDSATGSQDTSPVAAAQEQAGAVASAAKEHAADVGGVARDEAVALADEARAQARNFVHTSGQQLRSQAAEQSGRLAGSLRELGDQLRGMAQGQQAPEGPARDLVTQAASYADRFGRKLEMQRPEEMLDEVRAFARRRPGLFLAGALGAGFLAGRALRAVDTSAIVDAAKGERSNGANGSSAPPQPMVTSPQPVAASTPPMAAGQLGI
jgi:hypothetical protein